jgi:hypothetical protein
MITKIKSDHLGLYVIAGGYIARPFWSTCFVEGDEVKSHHFSGSTRAGVTVTDKKETHHFKKDGMYEYWCSTGLSSYNFRKGLYSKEKIEEYTQWYKDDTFQLSPFQIDHNKKFIK